MTDVNHTTRVGITTGAQTPKIETRTPDSSRSDPLLSEYQAVESAKKVADAAEIAPQEWLGKLSRQDYERHKQALTRLERTLGRLVDPKSLDRARQEGLVRFASSFLSQREKGTGHSKDKALLEELRSTVDEVKGIQADMEAKLAQEGPVDVSRARLDLAAQRLARFAGGTLSEEVMRDPAKVREQVVGTLRKKLGVLSEARRKNQLETKKWEASQRSASTEEKEKAEKILAALRTEEQKLTKGENLFSQSIVHAENWIRELEKGQMEAELAEELQEFDRPEAREASAATVRGEPPQGSRGTASPLLGTASVGDEGPSFEEGYSEYVELSGEARSPTDPSGFVQTASGGGLDLTGTRLSVLSSSGNARQEARRTKRLVQVLLKRLLAGDLRALDLALIMLSHQASLSTVEIGAKVIKSLDALDKHQQAIVDQLGKANPNDATFSSRTAGMNIQANRIASDRVAVTNLLRDVISSMEEIQNIAKSYLDIQGAQVRHLSRFNT